MVVVNSKKKHSQSIHFLCWMMAWLAWGGGLCVLLYWRGVDNNRKHVVKMSQRRQSIQKWLLEPLLYKYSLFGNVLRDSNHIFSSLSTRIPSDFKWAHTWYEYIYTCTSADAPNAVFRSRRGSYDQGHDNRTSLLGSRNSIPWRRGLVHSTCLQFHFEVGGELTGYLCI